MTYPSIGVLEDVGGFDVTMADAVAVNVVESPRGLRTQVQGGILRDRGVDRRTIFVAP